MSINVSTYAQHVKPRQLHCSPRLTSSSPVKKHSDEDSQQKSVEYDNQGGLLFLQGELQTQVFLVVKLEHRRIGLTLAVDYLLKAVNTN